MGRTRTKSFAAIATYLRDFANGPQTATQISEGMAIIPSLPSLARSTVANCLTSEGAPFYGITSVGVKGSSLLYYTFSEALAVAAQEHVHKQYSAEAVKNIILASSVEDKESAVLKHLSTNGITELTGEIEELNTQLAELKAVKEYYCRDDYERRILKSFRKARKAFDNEEALSLALSHTMATSVFVEGILPALSDPNKPSVNKVLMGAQLLLSDFKGDSK